VKLEALCGLDAFSQRLDPPRVIISNADARHSLPRWRRFAEVKFQRCYKPLLADE